MHQKARKRKCLKRVRRVASGHRIASFKGAHPETLLGAPLIVLGIILLIIGFVAKIAIIWTIGIVVVVAGAVLALLGMAGHAVGGRRHYF